MSYFIVEAQVPKGKLEKFMRATVGPWKMDIKEYVENGDEAPSTRTLKGKKRSTGKRGNPDSMLTMTGKVPMSSSGMLAQGLKVFEKMEVDQGVGTINVLTLREQLTTEVFKGKQLQTRLLHEDYLDYLD